MSGISTEQRNSVATTLVTTAETVALTIPFSGGCAANVSLAAPPGVGTPCRLTIAGDMDVSGGTAATAFQVRCRQGGLTGNLVGAVKTVPAAAAVADGISFEFRDSLAGFAQVYVITVQQVAATGNGTVNDIRGHTQDWN